MEYPYILSSMPQRCERVLDVGCADTPLPFLLLSDKIEAIDINESYIKQSKNRKKLLDAKHIEFNCYDASNLPYNNKTFDVVTCVSTLEHMYFGIFKNTLSEINRVLTSDGVFLLTMDIVPKTEEYLKYIEELYTLNTSVDRNKALMGNMFDLPYIGIIMMKLDKLKDSV